MTNIDSRIRNQQIKDILSVKGTREVAIQNIESISRSLITQIGESASNVNELIVQAVYSKKLAERRKAIESVSRLLTQSENAHKNIINVMSLLILLVDNEIHIDHQVTLVSNFLEQHADLPPAVIAILIPSFAQLGVQK